MAEQPEKIGKYLIQSVLGKGAMGVVYKAFDPGIERVVAVVVVVDFRAELFGPNARRCKLGFARRILGGLFAVLGTHG